MANVNFMMDDYQYKMYGIHVESENENQNARWWQVILTLIFTNNQGIQYYLGII